MTVSSGRIISSFLLSLAVFLGVTRAEAHPKADLVLHHAKIFTADPQHPWAQAVAIKGNKVLAVGSNSHVLHFAHPGKTEIIDAGGRTIVPGINDAHVHVLGTPGVLLNWNGLAFIAQAQPGPSLTDVLAMVAAGAQAFPPGTWLTVLVGENVDDDDSVTRFALDAVSPDHPVWLQMWTGHGTFVNSKALEVLGIDDSEADPMGGEFERVPGTSILTGEAHEYAEHLLRRRLLETVPDADLVQRYSEFADLALQRGVTSVQDIPVGLPRARAASVLQAADLPIRVRSICFPLSQGESCAPPQGGWNDPMLSFSGVKWIADGTPVERRAFLNEPYADEPGSFGHSNFSTFTLEGLLFPGLFGPAKHRQRIIHAVGDGAIDRMLDAVDATGGAAAWHGRRLRMEHGDLLFPENYDRVHDAGIVVVQNPLHFGIPGVMAERLSSGAQADIQPLRSLLDADIPVAFGSDSFGAPPNPWLDILLAVVHPTRGEAEAISVEEAITAYTRTAAYAEFAEGQKGVLKPGYYADLAVLSQDPFTVAPPALPDTESLLTVVHGEVRYQSDQL